MEKVTATSRLRQFIAEEHHTLLGTLRLYLLRAGLATGGSALESAAQELLNAVVLEALQHEDRFWAYGQPAAWLLGIAANLIKRQQADLARRNRREPLVRDLYPHLEGEMSDDMLFDRVASLAGGAAPGGDQATRDLIEALLGRLPPADQHLLRSAILHGMNGETLAQTLGISPGAARVRLHRALGRLRDAYQKEGRDEP